MLTSIIGQARDSFARESGMQMADVWQKRFAKHAGDARPPTRAGPRKAATPQEPTKKSAPQKKPTESTSAAAKDTTEKTRSVHFESTGRDVTFGATKKTDAPTTTTPAATAAKP